MKKLLIATIVVLALIIGVLLVGDVVRPTDSVTNVHMAEQYIRENITTLAPESAVLGGSWYVTDVEIDPTTHTGTVQYEDGHIQGSASFSYTRTRDQISVSGVSKVN